MMGWLPKGSKVTEADMLRGFMRNIHHAAFHCGSAGSGARKAYGDASKRLHKIEQRQQGNRLATPIGRLP